MRHTSLVRDLFRAASAGRVLPNLSASELSGGASYGLLDYHLIAVVEALHFECVIVGNDIAEIVSLTLLREDWLSPEKGPSDHRRESDGRWDHALISVKGCRWRMVKQVSRGENSRQSGFILLVSEDCGLTHSVERGCMVNLISRGEIKRQTEVRLLVGEKVGLTKLVERGSWSENLPAHPSSGQEDQRFFGIARILDVRPLGDGSI